MRFLRDDRAQSIQVGAVLLFGILIILLSTWQAFVIPNQNEEIEFNHNQEVQQQMTDLRSTVLSTASTDTPRSVTVDLGLRYPSRTIFRNPPPVSGTIQTRETTDPRFNMTIINAEPTNDDLAQLWAQNGSSYNTGAIEYRPSYNQYDNAPRTFYAHSVLFNKFDREQQQLPITGQSLVRDDRISLLALNGSLRDSRIDSVSVDFEPVSTQTREVEIESDNGPIQIEMPTRLNENQWNDLFASEPNVESVDVDPTAFENQGLGLLRLELSSSPYTLQLAKIGVGTNIRQESKAYVTDIDGNGSVIQSGQTQSLTVEVRDRFNKPLSGATMRVSAEGGVFVNDGDATNTTTATTDSDGRATLQYTGTTVGENAINVSIKDGYQPVPGGVHDTDSPTNLSMNVVVNSQPSSDGGGGSAAYNVTWLDPNPGGTIPEVSCSESGPSPESCTIDANASSYDLSLQMETDPVVDGGEVSYAVSNRAVGTIGPSNGTTDANGRDSATLSVTENGTVNAYVSSGSSGDRIEFIVTNITGNDTTAPTVSNFEATNPSGTLVEVSFDSDERLSTIEATVENGNSNTITSFSETNNGDGTYTYTGSIDVGGTGDYTAVLNTASDSAGNDGASGQSDAVTVSSGISLRSKIVDQGQTGSLARYEVSYEITNPGNFDRVELNYENLDSGGADETYTSTDPRTNIDDYGWTDTFGGTGGDEYQITIEVFDNSGTVVDSRTVRDVADGDNPGGNVVLSEADSPQLTDSALQDNTQNNNADYDVQYDVSDPAGKYTETEVLFYNQDTASATQQEESTALADTLSYSQGGVEGDTYNIIIQVQDDDGIVVDFRTITDIADGLAYAQSLQPGTVQTSNNDLVFSIENVDDEPVTVEKFRVDDRVNNNNRFDNGNTNELEIREATTEGRANRGANGDAGRFFEGETYDLVSDSDGEGNQDGQYAVIDPSDGTVTVDIGEFNNRLDKNGALSFVDSDSEADVVVTFTLSDGSEQVFYLAN